MSVVFIRAAVFECTHVGGHSIDAVVLGTIDIVLVTENADGHAWGVLAAALPVPGARETYEDGERWGA